MGGWQTLVWVSHKVTLQLLGKPQSSSTTQQPAGGGILGLKSHAAIVLLQKNS
jgi:hypothetical protein